ncbi:hypothetical protein LEP3755_02760 [Leptolyngbya sp. NIES-3755]|nr:hypothetical protein LEP3755_02760 [Leptolyngbya sp. NIES-3755]
MTISFPEKEAFSLSAFLVSDNPARFLLSWVAGFVDTAAFIVLFGIFTAHVTGNIALAGSAFASSDPQTTVLRLSMLPVFMLSVISTSLLARLARKRGWGVLPVLLSAEAIALGIFMTVGLQYSATLIIDGQDELIFPIAVTGVIAMGIQNALMKEAAASFTGFFPTTVMTGNFTNFTINLVHYFSAKLSKQTEETQAEMAYALKQIKLTAPLLVGFFLGGTGAAYFVPSAEFWSLSMPLLVVSMLAVAAYIQSSTKTQSV